ncbi:hypothetical protein ACLB1N_36180 [Escherichia coli]
MSEAHPLPLSHRKRITAEIFITPCSEPSHSQNNETCAGTRSGQGVAVQRRGTCISLVANGIQYWHATGVTQILATDNGRLVRLAQPASRPGVRATS